ncbi:MAG TPA: hypothetical protein VLI45_05070, partial [Acidobacteriaceae bacterium]|nr:hypothetical protein [Acidobacteriaceae bacterium]
MRHDFQTSQWLPFAPEIVFAFFVHPGNLPPLLPPWQHARIDEIEMKPAPAPPPGTPRLHVAAGNDTRVKISFRAAPLSPLRISWIVRIENFQWNEGFADVQVRGPFRYWRQQHLVHPATSHTGTHGTLLVDRVEYELPLAPLSAVLESLARAQIAGLFQYRHKRTSELLPRFAAQLSASA